MKIMHLRSPVVLLAANLLSLGGANVVVGEELRDPKLNAALQYWIAFAQLPRTGDKVFVEEAGERLSDVTRSHVVWTFGLPFLRRGAAMPYCEWGLNDDDGPGMLLPHLSKARHLARIAAFRFQSLAEDGKANEGVDDLAASFAFSRHVASGGVCISFSVHTGIDNVLIERSAFFLPQLDKAHLKQLAEALDRLPRQSVTSADAIRSEKRVFGGWMKTHFLAEVEKQGICNAARMLGVKEPALAGMTKEELQAQLGELDRFYDQLTDLHALPMLEYEKKAPEWEASLQKSGPLARLCLPTLSRVRGQEAGMLTRLQMYRAAIEVLLEGQGALARYPDPYDGKLFACMATPDGFELTSNLKVIEKAVTVTVGGKLGVAPKPKAAPPQGDPPPKAQEF
jgi:hypothetical protein